MAAFHSVPKLALNYASIASSNKCLAPALSRWRPTFWSLLCQYVHRVNEADQRVRFFHITGWAAHQTQHLCGNNTSVCPRNWTSADHVQISRCDILIDFRNHYTGTSCMQVPDIGFWDTRAVWKMAPLLKNSIQFYSWQSIPHSGSFSWAQQIPYERLRSSP